MFKFQPLFSLPSVKESDTHKLWRNIEPHLKKAMQTVYLREVSRSVCVHLPLPKMIDSHWFSFRDRPSLMDWRQAALIPFAGFYCTTAAQCCWLCDSGVSPDFVMSLFCSVCSGSNSCRWRRRRQELWEVGKEKCGHTDTHRYICTHALRTRPVEIT